MKILIFSNTVSNYSELRAGAAKLSAITVAYVAGSRDDAETAASYAQKVYFTPADGRMVEEYADTLKAVVEKETPDLIMISATKSGKFIAAKLAAMLGTSVMTDLSSIEADGSGIKGEQLYYGGAAVKTVRSVRQAIVTIGAGAYDPAEPSSEKGIVEELALVPVQTGVTRKEIRKKEGEVVNLAAAKKVVGVGRGIANKEDIAIAEALAVAIGAEVGCTRPIAEGEGWMDTARYVGVSGVMLKPDLYIAVGISGQVQHTIGMNTAKTIIAINKDKNAPIFKNCDYGIVGDLYKIVPALTEMIRNS